MKRSLTFRLANPNQTISAPTATYVISYDASGAMPSFNGYDEFYWDGPGFGNALIKELQITPTVPAGAQDATGFAGPPESTTPFQTKKLTKDGQARFAQTNVPSGESVGSASRSRRVWWRTTSRTWSRTAPSFHPPKGWVHLHWLG